MAIRNIVQVGDPTLRKKSFEVTNFDEKLHQLLDDMKDTLIKADGAGFDVLEIKDGVSLFRNPVQTMDKIKSLIPGLAEYAKAYFND